MTRAKMVKPFSGQTMVDPQTEIVILFDKGKKEDVDIRIDGDVAVRDGDTHKDFCTTDVDEVQGKLRWGIRKVGGFEPRDIFVQASTTMDCYTIEARFFVRGAKTEKDFMVEDKHFCETKGGIYSAPSKAFRDRVHLDLFPIDDEVIEDCNEMDIAHTGGDWRFIGCGEKKTYLYGPEFKQEFLFASKKPRAYHSLLNVRLTGGKTAHLPFQYKPTDEDTDWYTFDHGLRNVEFGEDIHVWWQRDKMITKRDPRPIRGVADNMLWTKKDIGVSIRSVDIMSKDIVLVNDHIRVNTEFPAIEEIDV